MGNQKNKKGNPLYRNLKGWEVNYLKQAEKYGHVGDRKVRVKTKEKR